MNEQPNKRMILIIAAAVDAMIGAGILLIYFGLLPIDVSGLGLPNWVVGVIGGIWFAGALAVLVYQLTKTDSPE